MIRLPSWTTGNCEILLPYHYPRLILTRNVRFPSMGQIAYLIIYEFVDSWKFSMLLLYLLWDDWPFFLISGSNEQLQQELEYTLLKSDCHCWWILKMQSDTSEEQYAIKFCFKLGRDSVKRGQHSSNRVSDISTGTMLQSITPSLSHTIW